METNFLRPGHRVSTTDGRQAEVLELLRESGDVRIAYLDSSGGPFGSPRHTGEERVVGGDEVSSLLGAASPTTWRHEVTIVLHHLPESEGGPAEYRAETLAGVPNDVIVSGGSQDSSRKALDHLLGGLSLMGFVGRVIVEDGVGRGLDRYEVEIPEGK